MMNCDSNLIDDRALMIESVFTDGYKSKITTTHGIYYSKMAVLHLLNNACIRYASTLEGRIQGTKQLMDFQNKSPILIEPNKIAAFPTMSYKNIECVWIFNHRFHVEELGKGKSRVTFSNGMYSIVNASKSVLLKQQQRLHSLQNMYNIIHHEKKTYIGNDPIVKSQSSSSDIKK
ncbi:competence protein ComK [Psychrobacillus vulpis]|uniref:Competence protein n=1 Tax=Psychrobacillus vulpis TaxID=2325572 RepID=A0A544TUZ1_9BACI|nr:competence protein ComK [Psychrobacillus vulpis]TQR21263.1 hypothetical protein FG384_03385 [Psychrobacillus vulpis]